MNPEYPIYIVSKGRWESRKTSKTLEKINVPYYIVVEKHEYSKYSKVIPKEKILILPKKYLRNYDTQDDIGESKSKGPGAARNFCWNHSIKNGFKWHWVMDDNIGDFFRFNKNLIIRVSSGTIFKIMEDFVNRYLNIAIAGPQYDKFIIRKQKYPPFALNTRIYSCLLIRNDIPYRWRGRYNEDTDICLRVMKDKWCTIEFNAFLQDKLTTQKVSGGNTEEFYKHEGTLPKSALLKEMHPFETKVVKKFNRWHHHVDYRRFKQNRLKKDPTILIQKGINDYGMKLIKIGNVER